MVEMFIISYRHFNTMSYALGKMIETLNVLGIELLGKNPVDGLRVLKSGSWLSCIYIYYIILISEKLCV